MLQTESRFRFGQNWLDFASTITYAQIAEAEKSLRVLLGRDRLDGLRFLDIGSGSGLFSLAARRLGATVHSFDYDVDSVTCTEGLRSRFRAGDDGWTVGQGSVLDRAFLATLDQFDIVYSWGVLHHTGAMDEAIRNAASLVAPDGIFAFSLYRKTMLCWAWTIEKRWYASAPPRAQRIAIAVYVRLMAAAFFLRRRGFSQYVESYARNRGMDYRHDVHDWLGGNPYESISPAGVDRLMNSIGFTHIRSNVRGYSVGLFGSGCDEYTYRAPHRINRRG